MSQPVHKQRRGTAAAMAAANELPAAGQIYFELDTNRVKIGDGTRRYNSLPYLDLKAIEQLPGLQEALDSKVNLTDPRLTDARSPTAHGHNDLYYTEVEIDALLTTKVNEGDARLTDARPPTTHSHDAAAIVSGTVEFDRLPVGTTSTTVCNGNDIRLKDQRTPLNGSVTTEKLLNGSVIEAKIANGSITTPKIAADAVTETKIDPAALASLRDRATHTGTQAISTVAGLQTAIDGKANAAHTHSAVSITSGTLDIARIPTGTTSTTVCIGNDARLSDARTPLAHTHSASDIVSGTIGSARLGSGTADATTFLRGDGTWAVPAGGSGTFTGGTLTSQLVLAGSTNGIDLSFTGSLTSGIRLRAADSIAIMTTSADRLVVTSGGSIGFGVVPGGNWNLQAGRAIAETGGALLVSPTVSSAMTTGVAYGVFTQVATASGSNVNTLYANYVQEANNSRVGTVTSQTAYMVSSTWVSGVSNFGFRSDIPEGPGRYNFYAGGTAVNQFLGVTLLTGGARVRAGTSNAALGLAFENDTNTGLWSPLADTLVFVTGEQERLRFTSDGKLLVGTSTSRSAGPAVHPVFQFEGTNAGSVSYQCIAGGTTPAVSPQIILARQRGGAGESLIVSADDSLGLIRFNGGDGTDCVSTAAQIECRVDGTPGVNDMPGRLMFSTTADGAAAATERMRITAAGLIGIGTVAPSHTLHVEGTIRATNLTDGTTTRTVTDLLACVKQSDVDASISALVDAAPATLNTLNELAAALNDDPSFAATVTNAIAAKVGSNTTQAGGGTSVTNMVALSQRQYDAIATKNANTIYFVTGVEPNAPTSLTATAGNSQLALAWTAPSDPGTSAITGYVVEYTPSGGAAQTVNTGSTSTSYTLTGLTSGTSYSVRVAAVNAAGTGAYSQAVTRTPNATALTPLSGLTTNGTASGSGTAASPLVWAGSIQWGGVSGSSAGAASVFTVQTSGTLYINVTSQGRECGDSDQISFWYKNGVYTGLQGYCRASYTGSFAVAAGDTISVRYEAYYNEALTGFSAYVA